MKSGKIKKEKEHFSIYRHGFMKLHCAKISVEVSFVITEKLKT